MSVDLEVLPLEEACRRFAERRDEVVDALVHAGAVASVARCTSGQLAARLERSDDAELLTARGGDAEIVEVTLRDADHASLRAESYLSLTPTTRGFHERVVHAPGSRVVRHLPLSPWLDVIARLSVSAVDAVLVGRALTLGEVRAWVGRAPPARPVCLGVRGQAFDVHGTRLDGYRMALHDLSHLAVLGSRPEGRGAEAARVFDALAGAFDAHGVPPGRAPWAHELLDHVVSGYDPGADAVAHVEARLDEACDLPFEWRRAVRRSLREGALAEGVSFPRSDVP